MLTLLTGLWGSWVLLGAIDEYRSRRRLQAIPHRILVGGIRGKTTLVRLIHAGLRAHGIEALGRVSGDAPTVLRTDGRECRERRWGEANIREIRQAIHREATAETTVLIIENMALDPSLQKILVHRLVRPSLTILASGGADHLEVLPSDPQERAQALLKPLPQNTPVMFSREEKFYDNMAVRLELSTESAEIWPEPAFRPYMRPLAGMARAVVHRLLESESTEALRAIKARALELQRLRAIRLGPHLWVDGLSVNDPASATAFCETALAEAKARGWRKGVHLFNHRGDRPSRLVLFGPLLRQREAWVMGDPLPLRWRRHACGPLLGGRPGRVVEAVEKALADEPTAILCLGNAGGAGQALRRWLEARGKTILW